MVVLRKFACGCVDRHDSALWASTNMVETCPAHYREDDDASWCQAWHDNVDYVEVDDK